MKNLCLRFLCTAALFSSSFATAQQAVTTYQNDNYRSGANTHETRLTTTNVNVNQFGRKMIFNVQGFVYAQPLYVPNVNINGTMHNVLYVATEHDQVYAFDVNTGMQLWHMNFLAQSPSTLIQITPVSSTDVGCSDLVPEIGVTGTPVIDLPNNEIFMVAKTKQVNSQTHTTTFFQTLHALDLRTGHERVPPRQIQGRYPGNGQGSQGGYLNFDPLIEGQRAGLTLQNGRVIVSWASHCDLNSYHGWLISYDELTLYSSGIYVDTPNGYEGGFWGGGSGPAVDSGGALYVGTGNGTFDATSGGPDYGDSVQKLTWSSTTRSFTVADYFTPWDQQTLDVNDTDLGSGGVVLLPDQPGTTYPHLLIQIGKEGTIDLINRDSMGHFHANNDSQIVQTLPFVTGGVWGGPAFWNNTAYFGGIHSRLTAFPFDPNAQKLSTAPASQSPDIFAYPGPTPTVSANGNTNGIVWLIQADASSSYSILRAFDASNVGTELYNSEQNPGRDRGGMRLKFTVPTIADGHVFVGSQNQVAMYGLLQ